MQFLSLLLFPLLPSVHAVVPGGIRIANDWIQNFNTVIQDANLPAQVANRYLAYTSVAIYETYQFIRTGKKTAITPNITAIKSFQYPMQRPHNYTIDIVNNGVDEDIAASAAAHYLLSTAFPRYKEDREPRFDEIFRGHFQNKGLSATSNAINISTRVGEWVGSVILASHMFDGFETYEPFFNDPAAPAGRYRFVGSTNFTSYPQLRNADGFVIKKGNNAEYKLPASKVASLDLANQKYLDDLTYVKLYGKSDSTARTSDQTELAYYWRLGSGTPTVHGFLSQIAAQLLSRYGLANNNYENAKLYALLHTAAYDANLASWASKYEYLRWRPESAIRDPGTPDRDATWSPLISTQNNPEFPSSHAAACAAAAEVLSRYFRTDNIVPPLSIASGDKSPAAPSPTSRNYRKISDIGFECGISRIYAGLHFNHSVDAGLELGKKVGAFVFSKYPGNLTISVADAAYRMNPNNSGAAAMALSALVAVASLIAAVAMF